MADECGPYFIDGHARDHIEQQAGAAEIPALIGHWTPAEEKQLIALINPLALMAQPVPEKQLQLLQEAARLADDPAAVNALNGLAAEAQLALDALLEEPPLNAVNAEPQLDHAQELRAEWGRSWYMWQHEPCFFGWVKGNKPLRTVDNYPARFG